MSTEIFAAMAVATRSLGIVQGDVLLRACLTHGLREIVDNPELLDYAFAWLVQDGLTEAEDGEQELVRIKEWFAETKIRVIMQENLSKTCMPCFAVMIGKSAEVKGTVGEKFYEVSEDGPSWPDLTPRFAPRHYDPEDGTLILPAGLGITPAAGMVLVTRTGRQYAVVDVIGENTVEIASNISEELSGSVLRGSRPRQVPLQGGQFQQTYYIGVYARGDMQGTLLWLHTICEFILLRRRQDLLEARGLQTCSIESGEVQRGNVDGEPFWRRPITLSGQVTHTWPGFAKDALNGPALGTITASKATKAPRPRSPVEILTGEEPAAVEAGLVVDLVEEG